MILLNYAELKFSAFLIGLVQVLWGAGFLYDSTGHIASSLELSNVREVFAGALMFAGLCVLSGSAFPRRGIRHLGLWLTPMITFPMFGFVVDNKIINIFALTLPLLGVAALIIMAMDTRGKPRAKMGG